MPPLLAASPLLLVAFVDVDTNELHTRMVKVFPLCSAPAWLLCLLRARLAALAGSALPGREAAPLGAQPLPRVLELAASKAADFRL